MSEVEITTDGSCLGNPGPGGWACVLRCHGQERVLKGGVADTTNNRMELTAAIEGLRALKRPCTVTVVTDSEYVRRGITEFLARWKRNDWRASNGNAVANRDLWELLDELANYHDITWLHVRGHSGDHNQDRCDKLAADAARRMKHEAVRT
jgi:ribonuclease HI